MKVIAKKVAGWCLSCDAMDKSEIEVVVYGLELILGTVSKYIILLMIGYLLNRGIEFLLILFLIAVFRAFAGGVHGKTSAGCFLYMLLVCAVSAALSELSLSLKGLFVPFLGYAVCFYAVYKYIPLQSLKNPACDADTIRGKKRGALVVVSVSVLLFLIMGADIKWIFLYPLMIEAVTIMLASR